MWKVCFEVCNLNGCRRRCPGSAWGALQRGVRMSWPSRVACHIADEHPLQRRHCGKDPIMAHQQRHRFLQAFSCLFSQQLHFPLPFLRLPNTQKAIVLNENVTDVSLSCATHQDYLFQALSALACEASQRKTKAAYDQGLPLPSSHFPVARPRSASTMAAPILLRAAASHQVCSLQDKSLCARHKASTPHACARITGHCSSHLKDICWVLTHGR